MKSLTAYQEVKQKITADLVRGRFPIGQALPAEKDLSHEFNVSIGTLRKAVDELVAEGIVIRRQGKGTFQAEHDSKRQMYYFFHVVKHDVDKKITPQVELTSLSSALANREEAFKLEIKEGTPVWRIVNRLYLEKQCVMIDQITLEKKRFKNWGPLRAGLAGKQFASWLDLKPQSPVITIRRIAFNLQDEPIEWRVSTLNTAQHEYFNELVV